MKLLVHNLGISIINITIRLEDIKEKETDTVEGGGRERERVHNK